MKQSQLLLGVVSAAAVVVLLAGCAAPVKIHRSTAPSRPTATATSTPTRAAVPPIRVPVGCGDLISNASAAKVIGAAVTIHESGTGAPVNMEDIAARQYGALTCEWGGAKQQDGGSVQDLTIAIAPDAAAGFAAKIAAKEAQTKDVVKNSAGNQSEYGCNVQGEISCDANMLVGEFWVTADLLNLVGTESQTTANSDIQLVLQAVQAALAGKTALSDWIPSGSPPTPFCSSSTSTATINSILGTSDFALDNSADSLIFDAEDFSISTSAYSFCRWFGNYSTDTKFTTIELDSLQDGSWAMSTLAGQYIPHDDELGTFSGVSIPGTAAAVSTCSVLANTCIYMFTLGTNLYSVAIDDPNTAVTNAAITKLVAAMSAG